MIAVWLGTLWLGLCYICIFHPVLITNHLSHIISGAIFKAKKIVQIR